MNAWKIVALAMAVAVAPVAYPKGNFQARGTISNVERHGVEINFRFAGTMSVGYATAPRSDPKRKWSNIALDAADVTVHISDWTQAHHPSEKAAQPETERIFALLTELMKSGSVVQLSVDNPSLSFSNVGELTRVSGTFVYARISDQRTMPNKTMEPTR